MNDTIRIGRLGESATVEYLRSEGYLVVDVNWRSGHHEIDIVATRNGEYHFVEVKTRKTGSLTTPEDALTPKKIGNLVKAINHYISLYNVESNVWLDLSAVEFTPGGDTFVKIIPDVANLQW